MPSSSTGAVVSPHLPVRQDWLDRRREEIIEPELPIVDPHHHLVDRPETGRYLLPDLLADIGSGHTVTATVYLEWLSMYRAQGPVERRPIGEIEFANGVAAMAASGTYGTTKVCAGIVGYADLARGASVETVLEAMIAAGGGRFRGIRFITASHSDQAAWGSPIIRPAGLLTDPRVREGFARLAPLGLSFDAWMYHTQLGDLVDLARVFPETPIVLDHVGGAIGLGPYAGKCDEVFAAGRSASWRPAPTSTSSSAGSACGCSGSLITWANCRRTPRSWPQPGGLISRPAPPPSAPSARCSRAISRSIRAAAAMPRCGTHSNASPPAILLPRKPHYSLGRHRNFIGWDKCAFDAVGQL